MAQIIHDTKMARITCASADHVKLIKTWMDQRYLWLDGGVEDLIDFSIYFVKDNKKQVFGYRMSAMDLWTEARWTKPCIGRWKNFYENDNVYN